MQREFAFLDGQSSLIKERMRRSVGEMATASMEPFDLKPKIRRHPLWSLGLAVCGGFVSGVGLGGLTSVRTAGEPGRGTDPSHARRTGLARLGQRSLRLFRKALGAVMIASLRNTSTPQEAPGETVPESAAASPSD